MPYCEQCGEKIHFLWLVDEDSGKLTKQNVLLNAKPSRAFVRVEGSMLEQDTYVPHECSKTGGKACKEAAKEEAEYRMFFNQTIARIKAPSERVECSMCAAVFAPEWTDHRDEPTDE